LTKKISESAARLKLISNEGAGGGGE